MVTEKSLKNLEKGRKTRFRTGEAQVKIAKKGAEAFKGRRLFERTGLVKTACSGI